jgi:pyruvate dehydrogenase E1 component alpha subunit
MAGELVDGNDVFAMHDACSRAVARARAGEGPTLIEARTYRMGPHNTSDDPTRYVPADVLEEQRAADPIVRFRRYLVARGLVDEASEAELTAALRADIDAAVVEVESEPMSGPDGIFEHVYARPPARMADQWRAATGEVR